jgi:hypothetical protein
MFICDTLKNKEIPALDLSQMGLSMAQNWSILSVELRHGPKKTKSQKLGEQGQVLGLVTSFNYHSPILPRPMCHPPHGRWNQLCCIVILQQEMRAK